MASTPSTRLTLTPSNSPFIHQSSRSPIRSRNGGDTSRLSLTRVIGTTCSSPTGFDTVNSSFAYIAGGAVVVVDVDVDGDHYSQRFFRARPTAVPIFSVSPASYTPSPPLSTPKANDSRNRAAPSPRESSLSGAPDWNESQISRTWTSRERIKAATCLALSRDGRYLAVGETGYAPRVLIFSLLDSSSNTPLVSISEHTYGVNAVAWSPDNRYLASLGTANDGFLYLWRIDHRTGAASVFQQNRCTAFVRQLVWMGNSLITLGVRHIKVWRVDDGSTTPPTRPRFASEGLVSPSQQAPKPLQGRNILLGSLLEATFNCALAIDEHKAIICAETGEVCLLDDINKQMKLARVFHVRFPISCVTLRQGHVHIGGKAGQHSVLAVERIQTGCLEPLEECSEAGSISGNQSPSSLLALGSLGRKLVTIDAQRSIDIWSDSHSSSRPCEDKLRLTISGHGDPIVGVQPLARPNTLDGDFFTWSGSGKIHVWTVNGTLTASFEVAIERTEPENEYEACNQLAVVRANKDGSLFFAGDKLGVLRIIDYETKVCLLETKAHASDCQDLTVYENKSRMLLASCGRDRTAQLFNKTSTGAFDHFQTLEFASRVVKVLIPSLDKMLTCSLDRTIQIHEIVNKEGEPDVMAALSAKSIALKGSPSSMTLTPEGTSVYISLLDRSVYHYDVGSARQINMFKCNDESGIEAVVLDSLIYGEGTGSEPSFLLATSNTDKSVRVYDAHTGAFLDREWGHTEAINGIVLLKKDDTTRRVVSVGSDGTIMIWSLDLHDPLLHRPRRRDDSPDSGGLSAAHRPPLRRVLSKAELAEFQRSTMSHKSSRRSPSRLLHHRFSKMGFTSSLTPVKHKQVSPSSTAAEDTPSRRQSFSRDCRSGSPPAVSPKNRLRMFRRPSMPALSVTASTASTNARKKSSCTLRSNYGFGSLSMATEQTCRQLRAFRKKLGSSDPINNDVLMELDAELRLTAAALSERAIRSRSHQQRSRGKAVSETLLSGLLDQYSERLVSMLDEKLNLRLSEADKDILRDLARDPVRRPLTADEGSSEASSSVTSGEDRSAAQPDTLLPSRAK